MDYLDAKLIKPADSPSPSGTAASSSPSSPCEERVGRGTRRGETNKNAPPLPNPPPSDGREGEIEELDAALSIRSSMKIEREDGKKPLGLANPALGKSILN